MPRVFISHSSSDKKIIRTLKSDLNLNGVDTWLDEDSIELGDSLKDKLEEGLKDSTHFVIFLTRDSVNSEWVRYELNNALQAQDLIDKIIPIKFGSCQIPPSLNETVYADLTDMVVRKINGEVEFIDQDYNNFLIALVRSIKQSERAWDEKSKTDLFNSIPVEGTDESMPQVNQVKAFYTLQGYKNNALMQYKSRIPEKPGNPQQDVYPVLLPALLKYIFEDLKYGDELHLSYEYGTDIVAHFAGFRKDDLRIALPRDIRNLMRMKNLRMYKTIINIDKRSINFLNA